MILYQVSLVISILMLLWLYISDARQSVNQYMMLTVIIVSDIGYIFLGNARELSGAIVAHKILYLGGIFIPMLYFFTVCEICRVKIPRIIVVLMAAFQGFIYGAVCTIGIKPWYYSGMTLTVDRGVASLEKVYGPLHWMYPVTMYGYYFCSLIIIIYAIIKNRGTSKSSLIALAAFSGASTFFYLAQRVFDLPYEVIPAAYVVLMCGAILPIYKSNLFLVSQNKDIITKELEKIALISFDEKGRFMGANQYMENLFPELLDCEVGKVISDGSEELRRYIIAAVNRYQLLIKEERFRERKNFKQNRIRTFKYKDHFYDGMIHSLINYRGAYVGCTLEVTDETDHYKAMELSVTYNERLSGEVDEKTKRIREIQSKVVLGMAQMVESRDLSTGGHIKRTSQVVRIFAKKLLESDMGLDENFLKMVVRSASMHDLGKIGVDDAILRKQGKFTDEEYEQMKTHSAIGAEIVHEVLGDVEEPHLVEIAENVAHYHHEKVNGKGYPEGLVGDQIPIEARIMALADVFDALVSKRCYKEAFSYDKAFDIIKEDAGSHFDPELARIFISCRPELEAYYNSVGEGA